MGNIAVLTSGGDAPGMNACIRAVVRTALHYEQQVFGVYEGYEGLMNGQITPMTAHDVSDIIGRGGTILKSARSERFRTQEGRAAAFQQLVEKNIDRLVVIGGDGSFKGAAALSSEHAINVMGIPGTIDNDMYGTDFTIGYDTAINTVVDAVDKIRDTAGSHNRLFFIEVMGRDAGFIAMRSGIGAGAEAILVPETKTYVDRLIAQLEMGRKNKKTSGIIIVAEGDDAGGAYEVAEKVKAVYNYYDTRVTVLGHVQRGGSPTALDRVLASRMGHAAVVGLLDGKSNVMVGIENKEMVYTPFHQAVKHHATINESLLELADILA